VKKRSYHHVTHVLAALMAGTMLSSAPAFAADEAAEAADAAAAGSDDQAIVVTGRVVQATPTAEAAIEYGNNVQIVGAQ